ncbi:L-rhamnose mutarotase [Actinosynnema sp. NPDC053489]|uniref:L-rhamnose mutarotase n=1 Tax=Actinosynnema sp. NPDC053489 TaxID=3363916 RepID=UPI0037C7EEF6
MSASRSGCAPSGRRSTGWGDYSLFLADDGLLVGHLETPDRDAARRGTAAREVNDRWQAEVAEFSTALDACAPTRP